MSSLEKNEPLPVAGLSKVRNVEADSHSFRSEATPASDRFWRSIDELSQTPEVLDQLRREFPDATKMDLSGLSRRQFTRLMAASLALAGASITGCRRWPEQVVRPQSERTEGFLPGVAEHFASQFELGGVATGILAKSVDGRPIKIEGNELHPFSNGAAGVFAQASILELYDPDRTRGYVYRPANAPEVDSLSNDDSKTPSATENSRETFENYLKPLLAAMQKQNGRGLHVLAQASDSPTFTRMRKTFESKFPSARWHVYQPLDRDYEFEGSKVAFGQAVRPQFQLKNARTIVCLDADILGTHPGHQRWCRDWASGRDPESQEYSRLWSFETGYSITGAAADIRQTILPSQVLGLVQAIATGLGVNSKPGFQPVSDSNGLANRVDQLIAELRQSGSSSLLIAGPTQPPEVHALVHAVNQSLGCIETTVTYTAEPQAENKSSVQAIEDLAGALKGKSVELLLILGGNPVYDCPADVKLALQGNSKLTSIHLGLFDNETAKQCTWHAPAAHFLESWQDGRAWDGTYSIGQPLIYPLFDGMSEVELLSMAIGQPVENGMSLVHETAREQFRIETDKQWNRLLHDGVLADSQYEVVELPQANLPNFAKNAEINDGFEICFVPDSSTYDGRFANNGWLQELPDPLTKLTWDNAALISKQDADQHGLSNGDVISIEVSSETRLGEVSVLIQPGQTPGAISLPMGYGRQTGLIAQGVGTNVYNIRTAANRYTTTGAKISRTGKHHKLACTQEHHLVDAIGRWGHEKRVGKPAKPGMLVRETTLHQHQQDPHAVHSEFHVPKAAPMFNQPEQFDSPSAWGMSIDLNACVGCNACVVACQAENNIPIVGKVNVLQNREMHWLRIDRYFKGDVESPDVVHVPMACAHCEDAPCEQVCPVAATVHDTEGLNAMVYNRCVGTRYCANNCPYKVRRFNYFDYHASNPKAPAQPWMAVPDQQQNQEVTELEQMAFNPEVSVRMRGVMEKCTYCVQRISAARINARSEHAKGNRDHAGLDDGEVVTACQQACPTQAIRFGDLNDKDSAVSQAHQDDRAYSMLEETNIKPRTRFLAKIRNVEANDSAAEEANHGHG